MNTSSTYRILSIDAWGNKKDGYEWNQWFDVGFMCALDTASTRRMLRAMRELGLLSAQSAGRVAVEDDQYNFVIVDRNTRQPLFAVAYGVEA